MRRQYFTSIIFLYVYFLLLPTSKADNNDIGVNKSPATPTTKSSSEIIGSSVVTSVSVILGGGDVNREEQSTRSFSSVDDDEGDETTLKSSHPVTAGVGDEERAFHNDHSQLFGFGAGSPSIYKSHRKDAEGVQNVLQALKTIVQEEQQKRNSSSSSSSTVAPTPTTTKLTTSSSTTTKKPPSSIPSATAAVHGGSDDTEGNRLVPGSTISGEDDDEMESSGTAGVNSSPTTDAIDEFAKHVVSMQPVEQDVDNDTATSAEVHDAIHKISGAILSVDVEGGGGSKNKKPIENIVTDVLSSINSARNESSRPSATMTTTTSKPQRKNTTTKKPLPSTTKKITKATTTTTTTKRPSSMSTSTTLRPRPVHGHGENQLKTGIQHQQMQNKNKVELPMIIMLEDGKPEMSAHDKEMIALRNKEKEIMQQQQQQQPETLMEDKPSPTYIQTTTIDKGSSSEENSAEPPPQDQRVPGLPIDDPFAEDGVQVQWIAAQQQGQQQGQLDVPEESREEGDEENNNAHGDDPHGHEGDIPVEYTTLRPYVTPPTKAPLNYYHGKRPYNDSTSSNRPNEFYDDEIFGYDPYQTFFHGVYVPVVEVGTLTEIQNVQDESSEEDEEYVRPKPRPKPNRRPGSSSGSSSSHNNGHRQRPNNSGGGSKINHSPTPVKGKKPVPTLPDHLHRPRPSHLQYQHGAADDTDPETGLLNAHYEHPGHGYGPDTDSITPDKLALHSRPALPTSVRKNFTDFHDQHILHQHGIGGHGHGGHGGGHLHDHQDSGQPSEKRPSFAPAPNGNPGLEATLTSLDEEKRLFVDINNRLALRMFSSLSNPVSNSKPRSSYGEGMVVSPFTVTSSLAMLFLGARGQTAAQLDGLLQLDDMLTFNPHMMYHNVTQSFLSQPNTAAAIIRLLVTDKEKGDVLEFYKTRVQHFYEARVEEVDYKFAGHLAQSIINQMIRAQIQRHSYEMLNYSLPLSGPMSLLTAAFFDGQFSGGRDSSVDSMNFIHLLAAGGGPQSRRLFQVPALALRGPLRAAYDKELDATAVELPYTSRDLSLILVMPGKAGEFAIGGVSSLKSRLNLDAWTKLMRGFYPRDPFKVVLPRWRHQTSVNLSHTLSRFGLTDMFEPTLAKFKGINGLADLFLDQNMIHFAEFGSWEKLSDTMNENNQQSSQNRNLDLIRILRPHVREHYGNYGQDSLNDYLKKKSSITTEDKEQQRSHNQPLMMIPDDVSRLRMELERLGRKPQAQNTPRSNPLLHSYSRVASTSIDFSSRPRRSNTNKGHRGHRGGLVRRNSNKRRNRSKVYYFRQENPSGGAEHPIQGEPETVLRFERPFLYALRHNPTGMILMMGQYTEPIQEIVE